MIPVKLQMYNFLSYGEEVPALDFTQFSIACLSGKNGQGKSALLDALTWAIWGEGRKVRQERKADSGLLKMGENQMWVDLTIDLEGERYRIIRKFSKMKNRNHSELELQVFDEDKSTFISLSSPSVRQTQQRINYLLRMDYDTFINSAFILQGRVDEFTRKSARERKQILSEVLGLSHYETLSELARQHSRELEKEIVVLDNRLGQIRQEIVQKTSFQEELRAIQGEEENQNVRIKETKENLHKLEEKRSRLIYQQEEGKKLAARIDSDRKELQEYERRRKRLAQNIKDYRSILSREKKILSDYDEYQAVYHENQRMIRLMQKYREIEKKKRETERIIEKVKNHLILQLEQKKQQYHELLEKTGHLLKQQEEAQKLELKIKEFNALLEKQELIQLEGNKLNVKIETKKGQMERLKDENQKNQEKIDLLSQGQQEHCPLCQSPLDEQKKERIRLNIKQDIIKNNQEIKLLLEETKGLTDKKIILQQEWKKIRDELMKKDEIQNELNTLSLMIKEGKQAHKQIKDIEEVIKNLKRQISQKQFAQSERMQLHEIENQLQKQGYNDQKYVEINHKLEYLKEAPVQKEKLFEAQKSLINLQTEQTETDHQWKSRKAKVFRVEQDYEKTIQNVAELPALETKIKAQQRLFDQLQQKYNQLFQKRGVCQEKLNKIKEYQKEEKNIKKQKNKLLYKKEVFEKLTTAFGKNGIQSMIIENAIPELEDEANAILSQLSNERTTVSLESLKDLKSGGVKETLDIQIHDEMGIRPYELYSGGETFRIDFAIRIALSKLLTYRAGARLRTLVIDEGFGTQDEDGLQKLIQAIHAIQNDFDKILVITHLTLLKDAFPVRIEVWKDPILGSQFELIHL